MQKALEPMPPPNVADSHIEHGSVTVDRRVTELWDRLMSYGQGGAVPIVALREETLALHAVITDEESRIGLMRIYNLICDLVAAHLAKTGGDLEALAQDRVFQIHDFLCAECRVDGMIDGIHLLYVTEREIRAGRMSEDDELRRYALFQPSIYDEQIRH